MEIHSRAQHTSLLCQGHTQRERETESERRKGEKKERETRGRKKERFSEWNETLSMSKDEN